MTMEPVSTFTAVAMPLLQDNIDTDVIIPSREIKAVSKAGLADGLFAGRRYLAIGGRDPDPAFPLNQLAFAGAQILLAGANFGCGSSREHAAWALGEFGFKAVIAPSFNPIFRSNAIRNGILPIELPQEAVAALAEWVVMDPQGRRLLVDLVAQRVSGGPIETAFPIDAEAREMLLDGLDEIALTLRRLEEVEAVRAADRVARPWIYRPLPA